MNKEESLKIALIDAIEELKEIQARLAILRRYHGGDGSVTREEVMKALADD